MRKLMTLCAAALLCVAASAQFKGDTFANPLDLLVGNERAYRGGEPVVLVYQDDYYLFVSHRKGYWYSPDKRPVGGVDNYADWMLLSNGKVAEVSSTYQLYTSDKALDENFRTCWAAATCRPREISVLYRKGISYRYGRRYQDYWCPEDESHPRQGER